MNRKTEMVRSRVLMNGERAEVAISEGGAEVQAGCERFSGV